MHTLRAIWKNGSFVPFGPVDWPEGCEVLIEPVQETNHSTGIDEADWRDDRASIADWDSWLGKLEPFELTPQEVRSIAQFNELMRQHNVEAVRRQMESLPK